MTGKQVLAIVALGAVIGALLAPAILVMVWEIGDGDSGF